MDSTGALHTVVVYPRSTEDVVKIVKIATEYRMPVTPFSGGTSLEGHYRGVSYPFLLLWIFPLYPLPVFNFGPFYSILIPGVQGSLTTDF